MNTSTRIATRLVSVAAAVCLVGCAAPGVLTPPSANPTGPAAKLPPAAVSPSVSPAPTTPPAGTTTRPAPQRTVATKGPAPARTAPAQPIAPAAQTMEIPAKLGTLSMPLTLPHQGVAANGDISAWTPTPWSFNGRSPAIPALAKLRASRVIAASGPEYGAGEGVAQFSDVAAANRFLDQVMATARRLDKESGDRGVTLHRLAASTDAVGDRSVALRGWYEVEGDGVHRIAPGGELTRFTRVGSTVVFAWTSGEYVGDTIDNPHANADTRDAIDHVLWQM